MEAITEDEFDRQFDTNVLGPFLTMREFARQPEADRGSIINISTAGISNNPAVMVAETPLGRMGQPEDIGPMAVFLASDDARWITGDVIFASGGYR